MFRRFSECIIDDVPSHGGITECSGALFRWKEAGGHTREDEIKAAAYTPRLKRWLQQVSPYPKLSKPLKPRPSPSHGLPFTCT
eukprot:2688655-Rhodomonas_salina.2